MDHTKGGYELPYVGVTGDPIDWDSMDLTSTGLVRRGYVLNFLVNGTTGMISLELFGIDLKHGKYLNVPLLFTSLEMLSFVEALSHSFEKHNKKIMSHTKNVGWDAQKTARPIFEC